MKVLILGVSGMLGHKMYQSLGKEHECFGTVRNFDSHLMSTNIFDKSKVVSGVDIFNYKKIYGLIQKLKPEVIINCIGVIKQKDAAKNYKELVYINSYLPHLLAEYCEKFNSKLVHISTDCVFNGEKGDYKESDFSDAKDLYGRSKFLGEINYGNSLTIRTSIIGHELFTNYSLVDWFLSQNGKKVNGFYYAIYTGLPTITFAEIVGKILNEYFDLNGLIQVSSKKINKYHLLNIIKERYSLNIKVDKDVEFKCNRSLDSSKFRTLTNIEIPNWEELITKMYIDYKETRYEKWKKY